jgi:hypothetical protein
MFARTNSDVDFGPDLLAGAMFGDLTFVVPVNEGGESSSIDRGITTFAGHGKVQPEQMRGVSAGAELGTVEIGSALSSRAANRLSYAALGTAYSTSECWGTKSNHFCPYGRLLKNLDTLRLLECAAVRLWGRRSSRSTRAHLRTKNNCHGERQLDRRRLGLLDTLDA